MSVGQRELFVPAPTRRLVGRRGGAVAGVDPSTKRCAIAVICPDGAREVEIVSFPARLRGAERLSAIYEGVRGLWLALGVGVDYVALEEPSGFGDRPNPELAYAAGVTLAALAYPSPPPVIETVESARWKKAVCGYGAIKKPKPSSGEEYQVLTWAREYGYAGSSWDEADAWAIAEWARRTVEIVPR